MSGQRMFGPGEHGFNPEFHDPVFEPSPEFNFEEEPFNMMSGAGFHPSGDFALYDASMQTAFAAGHSQSQQGPDTLSQVYWSNPFEQNPSQMVPPPSTQAEIVDSRADSVTQHFGQITPPDDIIPANHAADSEPALESDAIKRKERARNAANKRHAKSKKSRAGSESVIGDEDVGEERGERQAHYREKNRVAAAKCRAKKKSHNDQLEEMHRDEANKNKILKAELMGLRNELAQLKGLTLEHSPDSCQCRGIHEYSMRQASLIARGAAPQYGPSISSPVQDSPQSVDTPASEMTADGLLSPFGQKSPPMGLGSRRPSALNPSNWVQPS